MLHLLLCAKGISPTPPACIYFFAPNDHKSLPHLHSVPHKQGGPWTKVTECGVDKAEAEAVCPWKRSEAVDGALIKVVTPNGDTARESLFWCAVEKEDVQCLSDVYEVEAKRDLPWPKA